MPMKVIKPKKDRTGSLPDVDVNHPTHYTSHPSGIECIQVTEHYNFNVGNAIKYCWRNGLKVEEGKDAVDASIKDLKKAVWYLEREISRLLNQTVRK